MNTEALSQKSFSRERVRNRVLKRAAELWGFAESEIENFDPLVTLLIDAFAVEFEKMAGEISQSQNRTIQRLAELLYPGMVLTRPAQATITVRPHEPVSTIEDTDQFIHRIVSNDRNRSAETELFFSPVQATTVFDGAINYLATARELFEIESNGGKLSVSTAGGKPVRHQHSLWLGLDLNKEISTFEGLRFFFYQQGEPVAGRLSEALSHAKWSFEGAALACEPFLPESGTGTSPMTLLKQEYDSMYTVEQDVHLFYKKNFVTITDKTGNIHKQCKKYPSDFEDLFDQRELRKMQVPLLWIKVAFPSFFPAEAMDGLFCSINTVPVINRKLNTFTYKLLKYLNVVPFDTEDSFLAVRHIATADNKQLQLIPFVSDEELEADTYTLRYGINRFDERDATETLTNLLELIKEEGSYFSSLGEDFLTQNIRELNQIDARLREKIKLRNNNKSPYPYLIIKPAKPGANISVDVWSTNGNEANKVPRGAQLHPLDDSLVKYDSVFFTSPTLGGSDRLKESGKIDKYRRALTSRNRIVTIGDLEETVKHELDGFIKKVSCERAYVKSTRLHEGFIRCMQIKLTPGQADYDPEEWEYRIQQLTLRLERISANNIPYHFVLEKAI